MHNLKQLKIWQLSIELADCVYNATEHFPSTETYGLRDQMRRAAVSVGSNIAEGAGRNSPKEFEHFIGIANGSLNELIFQFELCKRRNLVRIEQRPLEICHFLQLSQYLQECEGFERLLKNRWK